MTTATIEQVGTQHRMAGALADLRSAHLEAATVVGALDLGDSFLWRQVDGIVERLATAAYDLTGVLTGQLAGVAATNVPPVVRARELATAQRRLFGVLNRHSSQAEELIDRATDQVQRLVQLLRNVTLSMQRDADRGGR